MRTIREYLKITLPLVVAMVIYQLFAVPYIELPVVVTKQAPIVEVKNQSETYWWSRHFLPNAWENQNPTVLKTKNGVLLFQHSEKLTPNSLKLSPLTIILPRGKGDMLGKELSEGDVLFIKNPEGAEIQFLEPIDITTGEPPPVVGGRLIGPIQIYGPASRDGKGDLLIETRDIAIDKKHLWTLHPVQMRMGKSQISGRDLSIYLDRSLMGTHNTSLPEDSPFQGLDRMELVYLEKAEFEFPHGGLWTPKGSKGKLPAKARVQSKGSFQFDFHSTTLHVSNEVSITHQIQGQPEDRFVCDDLRLRLGVPDAKAVSTDSRLAGGWTMEHLEATGKLHGQETDPGWWVQMDSPGLKTRAQGRHLELDLVRGRIGISNYVGIGEKPSSRTFIEHEGLRVWSPEIQLENDQLNLVAKRAPSTHLGALWADGPGSAQLLTEDNDEWKLSWSKRLVLQPDQEQDRLTIDGSANASSIRHGRFSSEVLDIWLFQLAESTRQQLQTLHPDRKPQTILADRFHASGHVIIDSPALRAQVEDMQVWLVHKDLARLQSQPASNASDALLLSDATGSNSSRPITQPDPSAQANLHRLAQNPLSPEAARTANGPGKLAQYQQGGNLGLVQDLSTAPRPVTTPLSVTGPILRSRVIVGQDTTTIDDLEIEGGVTMIRDRISDTATLPLTITGEKLKMNTADGGMMDVQIVGAPALIRLGSGHLQGTEVRFNQKSQLVWMDHPGSLTLPPEFLASTAGASSKMTWISPPLVKWNGTMTFDGKVARVTGGVKISGDLMSDAENRWVILGDAEQMEVHLTQAVVMGQPSMAPSEVDKVVLKNNVDLRALSSDPTGQIEKSRERLSVPELTFNMKQQTMLGAGPGWLRSRRIGQNGSVFGSHPLHCLHLTFLGSMQGNFAKGEVEFIDHIEALYGPIRQWDDVLDVNQLKSLALDQTLMTCDKLKIFSTSDLSWNRNMAGPGNQAWELAASGKVTIDSMTSSGELKVSAPEVQYAGLQELLRIYGSPHEPGVITRRNAARPSELPLTLEVSFIEVNARTLDHGKMQLIRASGGMNANPRPGEPMQGAGSQGAFQPGAGPVKQEPIPSPRMFPNYRK